MQAITAEYIAPGAVMQDVTFHSAALKSADPKETPYIYLTAGEREPLLDPDQRFAAQLETHHFDHEFHTQPGGHDWGEWNRQIPGCFESLFHHLHL